MKKLQAATIGLALAALVTGPAALARVKGSKWLVEATDAYQSHHSFAVPAIGTIEIAFSPDEGSEALVIKVIDTARSELRVLSYSFTSASVTAALVRAKRRGVDVRLVADQKYNLVQDRSGKARAALSTLVTAGVDVRTISVYPISHDKVVIADRENVELGSFNYSDAAAHRNSENVMVNWHNAKLAEVYLEHFDRNYRQSLVFHTAF